jgi:type I restriction enzyme M protein
LDALESEKENLAAQLTELEVEHGSTGSPQGSGNEGYYAEFDKVNKGTVAKRVKELGKSKDSKDKL